MDLFPRAHLEVLNFVFDHQKLLVTSRGVAMPLTSPLIPVPQYLVILYIGNT